jgi:hypothetical protein
MSDSAVLVEKGEPAAQGKQRQLAFYGKLLYFTLKENCNKPETTTEAIKNGWLYSGKILAESQGRGGIEPEIN